MRVASFQQASARTASYADDQTTRTLLTCGAVAGPLFMVVGLIQSFAIPGFDLTHHYLSMPSSSSEYGWIQISNFVVSGLLTLTSAVGIRRALRGGSFGGSPVNLRVTYRDSHAPENAVEHVGFRCAMNRQK